ncbi:hypothetical protein ACFOOM_01245 [Streptomyces echinoruber]|uniref:Homeodomain-like domain-containing protein n=1 Tax=Streptomyces echinoruber TaxID=68898 RepID=A0A918QXE2_9ACTN|nr:hypothetical protein [Streptomyces echinoruber]GGZ72883.1 hypothetical protein GCM10010389_07820 [Streptomyces echinoruber]
MSAWPYATCDGQIDLVAVERVLRGTLHHSALTPEERKYAARHSTVSVKDAARLLGVTDKTIQRWREEAS